jgi:hypothetical protein
MRRASCHALRSCECSTTEPGSKRIAQPARIAVVAQPRSSPNGRRPNGWRRQTSRRTHELTLSKATSSSRSNDVSVSHRRSGESCARRASFRPAIQPARRASRIGFPPGIGTWRLKAPAAPSSSSSGRASRSSQ